MNSVLIFTDPSVDASKFADGSTVLRVRHAGIHDDGNGRMLVEKYDKTWDELPHVMAGSRQAVVAGSTGGLRDVHMRMTATKLIQTGDPRNLGWDQQTVLRFVGSCGYVK